MKTKSFFLKNRKPTVADFLPENRKQTIKEMRAYASKLPTTPGFKLERRSELETMCEQNQFMTANRDRIERLEVEEDYTDDDTDTDEEEESELAPPFFWNSTQRGECGGQSEMEGGGQSEMEGSLEVNKKKGRPIAGRIPCYWATLTTAPFRSSLFSYYISGNHSTEKDVKVRARLAKQNPDVVAWFAELQLELVLKYVMKEMLELDDYYAVFEWGSGGVLHLHCILWNRSSEYLEKYDLQKAARTISISRKVVRKIANFFNVHVSEYHLGKTNNGSWDELRYESDGMHPASISKSELDRILTVPTYEDPISIEDQIALVNNKIERVRFIIDLLETVQQHNLHKPDPIGPPLPTQKCSKDKPKKKILGKYDPKNYCSKGYPKEIREYGKEDVLQDPYKPNLWKLFLERNCMTLNNYNPIISLALLANCDIQPVMTYDGLIAYATKYVTKDDNPDLFRDFRDDSGRPVDPSSDLDRTEIPVHNVNIANLTAKLFNEQIKYSMISSPELHHHLLNLPTHFASRSFMKISLQSNLNKLLKPTELVEATDKDQVVMQEDAVSTYEKRSTYEIPRLHRENGITEDIVQKMSLFLFHKHFFARSGSLCRKSKPPIIMFRPYLSPRKKNNPKFAEYMASVLLSYKSFENRDEFLSLTEDALTRTFQSFLCSGECPFFVIDKYEKANAAKEKKGTDGEDETEEENISGNESDEALNVDFIDNLSNNDAENASQNVDISAPPIAKFTEAYQEYGHMAPKGLDIEGADWVAYDDDNDVVEEIKVLRDEQDMIFDHTKETWSPLLPHLSEKSKQAATKLNEKIGAEEETQVYNLSELDTTQRIFVDTILEWTQQCIESKKQNYPFPPLKMKLLGVAGTGKSRTIKTIIQEFKRLIQLSGLEEEDHGSIVLCAPTGVAAFNIGSGAASIHKTFNIPVKGKFTDLTGDAQERLESDFKNAWLVIIDEISMVGCELFAKVNERLIQAKLDQNSTLVNLHKDQTLLKPSFGGTGVIICGDFAQLVPIMQQSLMDNTPVTLHDIPKEKDRFTVKGKLLFKEFRTTVMLTKQHRQRGGDYSKICLKFRDGSFTPEDHLKLQKRNYDELRLEKKLHLEQNGTRIVTTNKDAGNWNGKRLIAIAKSSSRKIFRINAFETGAKSKALSSSDNFGGLKSTIHLTIGSRVMLTSNIWVEAGLINGAQGSIQDICFHEKEGNDDPFPNYVIVQFDDYKGPALYEDTAKRNWVPIFPLIRRNQCDPRIERQQLPLRLSSAMTGHKVQGLSLYQGVVVQFPASKESRRDPMDIWGLYYCILTRVPDIDSIAFINLPDYRRHMKLYTKKKGKDHFKMFQQLNKSCELDFKNFIAAVANIDLKTLANATERIPLLTPINFSSFYNDCQQEFVPQRPDAASSNNDPQDTSKDGTEQLSDSQSRNKERNFSVPLSRDIYQTVDEPGLSIHRFTNSSNSCWFNASLQLIDHARREQGEARNVPDVSLNNDLLSQGAILFEQINRIRNLLYFNVDTLCQTDESISMKRLMLRVMGVIDPREVDRQHDAAECLRSLLSVTNEMSFLWHHIEETLLCENCGLTTPQIFPWSIAAVDISSQIQGNRIDIAQSIVNHFDEHINAFGSACPSCHAEVRTKTVKLPYPPNFVVVQLKRFISKQLRNRTTLHKINEAGKPFSSIVLKTEQGQYRYNVVGTIEHIGEYLIQGHYISYIFKDQNWYKCDDHRITPIGVDSDDPTTHAYVILLKLAT